MSVATALLVVGGVLVVVVGLWLSWEMGRVQDEEDARGIEREEDGEL